MTHKKTPQSDYERELEHILENYREKAKDSENEVLHGAMTEKEAFDELGDFAVDFNQEVLKLKLKHGKLKSEKMEVQETSEITVADVPSSNVGRIYNSPRPMLGKLGF